MRDIEEPLECPTRIDIGFVLSNFGLIHFGYRRRVGTISFFGVERIRPLIEETILDAMGNEVAICLRPMDCMVVLVKVGLELCARGCEVRVRVRFGERSEDG